MKPSMLIIAHTYAVPEHAKKLPELARHFDLTCATVRPEQLGLVYGATIRSRNDHSLPWMHHELEAMGAVPFSTATMLKGLGSLMRSRMWDYVLVENEPWSLIKWQTLFHARWSGKVRYYGEFTWENVLRPSWKGQILAMVYRLTARWTDYWVCGNVAASEIVRDYGTPSDRVLVCPQVGVDPAEFKPFSESQRAEARLARGLDPGAFIVGFAGRLVPEKGVPELVEAGRRLAPASGFQLAVMGQGKLLNWIREEASTASWLKHYPPVPHHDVPDFLRCLDVLVLGSHPVNRDGECWEEQFGHILVEAIACGAVAIGSRSGAIPEVLGDDELTFAVGNGMGLSEILVRLRNDKPWCLQKRHMLMERVRVNYTHAAVADRLANWLKQL